MSTVPATTLRSRFWDSLPGIGFICVVLGAKLILIGSFANQTPYWDQWDSEAAFLYRPWLDGTWDWRNLFAPHNEHRILTTRLLALAEFEMNGQLWDPLLEMQVNACLHIAALLFLLHRVSEGLITASKVGLYFFSCVIFVIPYAWANTLAGFQSAFYFELLFSFLFLSGLMIHKAYTALWWLSILFGLLSVFSLASGALTVAAGIVSLVIRRLVNGESSKLPVFGLILLSLIAILSLAFTPTNPAHEPMRAHSIGEFLLAFAQLVSWPEKQIAFGAITMQTPLVAYVILSIFGKKPVPNSFWFIFAMFTWLFGQFAALAFGRSTDSLASRYQDLFAIGLVLNAAVLLIFLQQVTGARRTLAFGLAFAWVAILGNAFYEKTEHISKHLHSKRNTGLKQETYVREYLRTGDFSNLANKPFEHIPYPISDRLKSLLDDDVIKSILPGNILEANAAKQTSPLKRCMLYLSAVRFYLCSLGIIVFATLGILYRKHVGNFSHLGPRLPT